MPFIPEKSEDIFENTFGIVTKQNTLNRRTLLTYESLYHCQKLKQIVLNSTSPSKDIFLVQLDILEHGVSDFNNLLSMYSKVLDLYNDNISADSFQIKYICKESVMNISEMIHILWLKKVNKSESTTKEIINFADKTIAICLNLSQYMNDSTLFTHANQLVRKDFGSDNEIFVHAYEFSIEFIKHMKASGDLQKGVRWLGQFLGWGLIIPSIVNKLIDNASEISFNMELTKYQKQRDKILLVIRKLASLQSQIGPSAVISEMVTNYANYIYEMDCGIIKYTKHCSRTWCIPILLISLLWAMCSSSSTPDFIFVVTLLIYIFPSLQKLFSLYQCQKQRDDHLAIAADYESC